MSGHALPPQNCPFPWRNYPHLIRASLGSTRLTIPTGISIGSAVFAALTMVTDRPSDRQTTFTRFVTIGRIYVRSTAMRPNSNNDTFVWRREVRRCRYAAARTVGLLTKQLKYCNRYFCVCIFVCVDKMQPHRLFM